MPAAHRASPARQPSPGSAAPGAGPNAVSTISVSRSSLAGTYRYRAIVEAPSSAATRPMDTDPSPSVTARWIPAATIRSRLSPGFGPRRGRPARPQASAMLGGNGSSGAAAAVASVADRSAVASPLSEGTALRSGPCVTWSLMQPHLPGGATAYRLRSSFGNPVDSAF